MGHLFLSDFSAVAAAAAVRIYFQDSKRALFWACRLFCTPCPALAQDDGWKKTRFFRIWRIFALFVGIDLSSDKWFSFQQPSFFAAYKKSFLPTEHEKEKHSSSGTLLHTWHKPWENTQPIALQIQECLFKRQNDQNRINLLQLAITSHKSSSMSFRTNALETFAFWTETTM